MSLFRGDHGGFPSFSAPTTNRCIQPHASRPHHHFNGFHVVAILRFFGAANKCNYNLRDAIARPPNYDHELFTKENAHRILPIGLPNRVATVAAICNAVSKTNNHKHLIYDSPAKSIMCIESFELVLLGWCCCCCYWNWTSRLHAIKRAFFIRVREFCGLYILMASVVKMGVCCTIQKEREREGRESRGRKSKED